MAIRKIPYTANVQVKNSYNFGVLTSGIDLDRFKKNPIVLKNHSLDYPIGTAEDLKFSKDNAEVVVVIDDESDEGLQKLIRDIDKKLYQGLSMYIEPDFDSVEYGVEGFEPNCPVFTRSELMEVSITPLPSNKECLRLSHKGEILSMEDVKVKLSVNNNFKNHNSMNKVLLAFIATFKLSANTTEEQVIEKLSTLHADLDELATLRNEKTEWAKKDNEMKLSRNIELVDNAIAAKKILPAQKEDFVKLAAGDYDAAKKVIDALPVHKTLSGLAKDDSGTEDADPTKDWKWDDFHKKNPAKLTQIKEKDNARYIKLFNERFAPNA
jgi:hypothetical protein